MATNCRFILKNNDFDHIDDELINETLQCTFPHYNGGKGCPLCPIYKQLMETRNIQTEKIEHEQENIQLWWV